MTTLRYVDGIMPEAGAAAGANRALAFVDACLRGTGQICLTNNPLTGLLVLVALTAWSPWLASCTALGVVSATAIGSAFRVDPGLRSAGLLGVQRRARRRGRLLGLWGYNGYLTAVAVGVFLVPSVRVVVLGALAAVAATVGYAGLDTVLAPSGLPALTLPFCLVTIAALLFGAAAEKTSRSRSTR